MTLLKALTCIILILAIAYIGLYLYLDYRYEKRQKEFKDKLNKF
jgi:Flp pilus assembly protein TadB